MKKRIIALALCFVMLLGCLGMGVDALTDTAPLYDRLIAAQTAEEFDAIAESATEEELSALTEAQLVEISNRYAAILGEDAAEPITYASSSVNNVGPLVKKDAVQTKARLAKAKAAASQQDTSEPGKDEGLILDKYATKNDDGTYKLTLESFVTGEVKITQEKLPADIVLVLDVSGSMDDDEADIILANVRSEDEILGIYEKLDVKYGKEGVYTWGGRAVKWGKPTDLLGRPLNNEPEQWVYDETATLRWKSLADGLKHTSSIWDCNFYISKLNAMKIAVKNFVDQVQINAAEDGVEHTISIVKFAGNKNDTLGNSTYRDSGYTYNFSQVVLNSEPIENANAIKAEIDKLTAGGATHADYGMQHAQKIINGIERQSNKVVVMFTDGEPTSGSKFEEDVANDAIEASNGMKLKGTTVYTIGVFKAGTASDERLDKQADPTLVSQYMHYVSSNFKYAENMSTPGTPTYPDGVDANGNPKSYFLLADSASRMTEIFGQISEEVSGGASMQLGAETVLRDIVTDDFDIVAPNGDSDIKVYTAAYQGYKADGTTRIFDEKEEYYGCTVNINGQTVEVTGFDYSSKDNCVTDTNNASGTTHTGKKLIVEFNIRVSDSCMGGGWFYTNENASGIYKTADDNDAVGKFPVPNVNVPRKTFDLTIKKEAAKGTKIDENQTFVFTVKGTDEYTKGVNTQVIIEGDGSVTLKDLPVGKYTVTEDTNWSWRYSPTANDQIVYAQNTAQKTVTFVNSLDNNKWLSFLNRVTNVFGISNAS